MLGQAWWYNRTFRKVINAVGAVFNDIQMVKYDYTTNKQLGVITVPLTYEGKETFVTRIMADVDATRGVQITLPAMTYEWKSIRYANNRKQSGFIKGQLTQTGNTATRFNLAVPFDMQFELNIYSRNIEDGAQIIEQILPLMTPQYTIALKYIVNGTHYISEKMPIILEGVQFQNDYEGVSGTVRQVVWTINFNVQTFLYGPEPQGSVIKEVIIQYLPDLPGNTNLVVATTTSNVNPITANVTDTWNVNTSIVEIGG